MRIVVKAVAAMAVLGVAACAAPPPPPTAIRDTGNMAYPTPLPQGNVSTTTTVRPPAAATTGNMAYPAPLPQGNLSTTTTGRPATY